MLPSAPYLYTRPPVIVSALDAATTLWVNAVNAAAGSSVVSSTNKTIVDTLIRALKTDASGNLFTLNDRLWLLALAGESTFEAQVDIIGLQSWTSHGSFTLDANGFAGNGSTGYLDTGFIPSTAGGNFSTSSASMSIAVLTNRTVTANVHHMGTNSAGETSVSANAFGSQSFVDFAGQLVAIGSIATAKGLTLGSYVGGNNTLYINGSSVVGGAQTVSSLSTDAIFVGAENNGGSPLGPTSDQIVAAHIGGGMNSSKVAAFTTIVNAALTSLGKNVF